jgi:membrane-associated protease RseP (regulator of RpoE activity)
MSFYIYDVIFLVLFSAAVGLFLWKNKKGLEREGILYLYRTQVGVKFINYVGSKYKRTLKIIGFIAVICGYLLMVGMIYLLVEIVGVYLFQPEVVRAIKIPPLIPLVPYLPEAFNITFLPPFYFTYWIIAIAIVAIFHEFSHGIYMKLYGIKIKSTGFGFLGPFLAAFVEQDEKDMEGKPKYEQIVVLSAGVFANLILAIIFLLMLSGFFLMAYVPAGALFNDYGTVPVLMSTISTIGGKVVIDNSPEGLLNLINDNGLEDDFTLESNGKSLKLTKIIADNKTYYMTIDELKLQLDVMDKFLILYADLPAINVAMKGVIIQIDEESIIDQEELSDVLSGYSPGDEIKIVTKYVDEETDDEEIIEYNLVLGESPYEEGRAMIGIKYNPRTRLLSQVTDMFNFFKKPATSYEPRFNADFILFIYHLIWWLALINLSVAFVNMWPVAIFDGGRMFMLTIWAITGSEKIGMWAFKAMTYLILGALFLLMFGWTIAWF